MRGMQPMTAMTAHDSHERHDSPWQPTTAMNAMTAMNATTAHDAKDLISHQRYVCDNNFGVYKPPDLLASWAIDGAFALLPPEWREK